MGSIILKNFLGSFHTKNPAKKNQPHMILYLLVSQMCNIRCEFCYQKNFGAERLSDDILYNKLKPLYPLVKFLPIVGGEVTVVPGMKEYVEWIKKNYPHIDILIGTNGVEFDEEWINLSEKYNLLINYSLNAIEQETYNKILSSGDPEIVFRKINRNFYKLLEAQRRSQKNIINEISMVVTEYTACDVEKFIITALEFGLNPMIRFNVEKDSEITEAILEAERVAIKLKFFSEDYITVTPWHNPNYLEEEKIICEMRQNLQEEKKKFLKTHKKQRARRKTITYIDYLPKQHNCPVINHGLAVEFDGTVVPCYNLPNYVIGNIYYNSIDEIMGSKELEEIKQQIKCGNYKYCFERCPLNLNPNSSIKDAEVKYKPLYEQYFDEGNYEQALAEYRKIERTPLFKAKQQYEMAYCLHVLKRDSSKAINLYGQALEHGFNEFWVRYNRGALYMELMDLEHAKEDFDIAYKLEPQHEGLRMLRERINK